MGRILLLMGALLVSGCAQMNAFKDLAGAVSEAISGSDNAEPPRELQPLEPTVNLTEIWSQSVGKGFAGRVLNLVPAVTPSHVYAADHLGLVAAFQRSDGAGEWSAETGLELSAGPVVAGDRLLVGTSNAELVALSMTDGALLWKTALSSEVMSLPRVSRNMVVVRTSDGRIAGIDLQHGGIKWTHQRTLPALSVRSLGSPTISGDLVIDGFGAGKLVALSLQDGHVVWESTLVVPRGRSEVERMVELDADPVVHEGVVYATGFQGGMSAVDVSNGSLLWHQKTGYSSHSLLVGKKSIYLTDTSSDLWDIDLKDGADRWKQDVLHQRRLTVPGLLRDYLVVGDFEGYLHLLRADTGSLVGRLEVDSGNAYIASPEIHEDTLYVYSTGGRLSALRIE